MGLVMLLAATSALVAGSLCVAAWVETASLSRRLLVAGVLVPAQITTLVLVLGWALRTFRPVPLLLAALVLGGAEVALLRRRVEWSGAMAPRAGARRVGAGLRRHPGVAALVAVAAVSTGWRTARAIRLPDTTWDALAYHLPEPSTWVLEGRFVRSGITSWGVGYPQGQEVLHGWTMVFLHSIMGTGLVPLWLALLGALAVVRLGRVAGASPAAAAIGGIAWLTMPSVALQIGSGYVDTGAAGLALAALALALEARTAEAPFPLLFASSVAAGLAVAVKPSMAPVVLGVGIVGLLVAEPHLRRGAVPTVAVWGGLSALALLGLGGVWYLTNLVLHGNPVYPVSAFGFEGEGTYDEVVRFGQVPAGLRGEPLPIKLWRSWTADLHHHPFVIDQRLGGLGAVWVLCLPALGVLAARPGRPRPAGGLGPRHLSVAGSIWWARYSLVLAGVGCVALGVAVDAARPPPAPRTEPRLRPAPARRALAPALVATTLLLVTATSVAALAPTPEIPLDTPLPWEPMSFGELTALVARGHGEAVLRPWSPQTGLDELAPGATIAQVAGSGGVPFAQVAMGIGLDHRFVIVPPPPTPAAFLAALREAGARYVVVASAIGSGSVEAMTVADGLHFRPVTTRGMVTGGTVYEIGSYSDCGVGTLSAEVVRDGAGAVARGRFADGCGGVAGATVEVWAAGSGAAPWVGARIVATAATDDVGTFATSVPGEVDAGARLFVRSGGLTDGDGFHRPAATGTLTATG